MRNKLAKYLITIGVVCVIAGLSLFWYNKIADFKAGEYAGETVSEMKRIIESEKKPESDTSGSTVSESGDKKDEKAEESREIDTVRIKGEDFIGYISIPSMGLELPVMAEWSYEKLKVSPCRFSGSPETDDFVIAAHNYSSHFGNISELEINDRVSYTDIHGKRIDYKVILVDTLSPGSVNNMTSGEYDLTLFTCTYSGQARVTVRLNRLSHRV